MTVNVLAFSDLFVAFLWPLIVFPSNLILVLWKKLKSQKKRFPEYPGFEPGNSDPIATIIFNSKMLIKSALYH